MQDRSADPTVAPKNSSMFSIFKDRGKCNPKLIFSTGDYCAGPGVTSAAFGGTDEFNAKRAPEGARFIVFRFVRSCPRQLHPLVEPQVSHFRQVPLRTMVKLPHSAQFSPS